MLEYLAAFLIGSLGTLFVYILSRPSHNEDTNVPRDTYTNLIIKTDEDYYEKVAKECHLTDTGDEDDK